MYLKYRMLVSYILLIDIAHCFDHCQDGWVRFHEACYLFSKEKENWPTAMNHCKSFGSSLVDIVDAQEDNFLSSTLTYLHSRDPNKADAAYWTAGTDEAVEGQWLWASTQETVGYVHWSPLEPSNSAAGNCLSLWGKYNFAWDDISCTDPCYFICKQRLGEVIPVGR